MDEYPMSAELKRITTELGGNKWKKYEGKEQELKDLILERINPLEGHGVSPEAMEKFRRELEKEDTVKGIIKLVTNYTLAGMGFKVIKSAGSDKLILTIDLDNEAFKKDSDAEISRIFLELSKDFQFGRKPSAIRDANGNICGKLVLK